METNKITELKQNIYIYHIVPFDSLGIYLADSKEDAIKSIYSDIWENASSRFWDNSKPINIIDSIEVWSWEEYQNIQGFKVSERLLEIIS